MVVSVASKGEGPRGEPEGLREPEMMSGSSRTADATALLARGGGVEADAARALLALPKPGRREGMLRVGDEAGEDDGGPGRRLRLARGRRCDGGNLSLTWAHVRGFGRAGVQAGRP